MNNFGKVINSEKVYKSVIKIGEWVSSSEEALNEESILTIRKKVEPWLSGILQSEHVSMLIGSGLTQSVCKVANVSSSSMAKADFKEFNNKISEYA